MIASQLRRRRSRALALGAGTVVAATSFTLLTTAVTTSQAQTVGVVQHNVRSAYDVLVRPQGSETQVEKDRDLVQANFLSGIYGGITLGQYRAIGKLAGVQVAAPVANVGTIMVHNDFHIDVSRFLKSSAQSQVLRVRTTVSTGLQSVPGSDEYLYLTRAPLKQVHEVGGLDFWHELLGQKTGTSTYYVCWYYNSDKSELLIDGYGKPLKPIDLPEDLREWSPFNPDVDARLTCQSGSGQGYVDVPVSYPVLLSAIDPDQENRLVGLDHATVAGRALREGDKPAWLRPPDESPYNRVPVVLSSRALTSGRLEGSVEQLDVPDPGTLAKNLGGVHAHTFLNGLRGTPVGKVGADLDQGFPSTGQSFVDGDGPYIDTDEYWTTGPVRYTATGSVLHPVVRPAQSRETWRTIINQQFVTDVPEENKGTQFRTVTPHSATFDCGGMSSICINRDSGRLPAPVLDVVGRYDPDRLPGFSALSAVPMETYRPPSVVGADAATRSALHDAPLQPDRNLGGYLGAPPTLLTTLDALTTLTKSRHTPDLQDKAPISSIRIRVAGVTGVDAVSRARVSAVAGEIHRAYPDLQVDITIGSSPAPQNVALPGGLTVREDWTAKGVALRILKAADRKSEILFVLVLVVCALFLSQAALASVRSRRTEIGTLRCLGWSGSEVMRLIVGELAVVGALSGAVGTVLAYVLGAAPGMSDAAVRAALVLPVALLLTVVAGLLPAWKATRLGPLDAVNPPVTGTGRASPVRSVRALAWRNLTRTPGRTALGAAGIALGVAAFTVLLALTLGFRGQVAGSLLGNAVVAQARSVDYVSVALSLLLGAAGAVDVLVLSQRERAADLAVLRATGWSDRELARLSLYEGALLGLLGGIAGAVVGLATVLPLGAGLLGGRLPALTGAALLATAAGVLLVCGALTVPIRALSRIAPVQVLAEE
ncbi:ABC transporter permease [Streptomyces sp. PLK6-54]|uniref:ABC transporter permease n=2 Tax=Actinacidiphila acidipaludis TaxID=2873382 RepID=A0ABS7QD42_9ACTN|nr:ABC transporter permease [Streptomyces acidipaludis]